MDDCARTGFHARRTEPVKIKARITAEMLFKRLNAGPCLPYSERQTRAKVIKGYECRRPQALRYPPLTRLAFPTETSWPMAHPLDCPQ